MYILLTMIILSPNIVKSSYGSSERVSRLYKTFDKTKYRLFSNDQYQDDLSNNLMGY